MLFRAALAKRAPGPADAPSACRYLGVVGGLLAAVSSPRGPPPRTRRRGRGCSPLPAAGRDPGLGHPRPHALVKRLLERDVAAPRPEVRLANAAALFRRRAS